MGWFDCAAYSAQPIFTGPPERSRFYGLRLMVKEARNERKGVEAWMDLYTLYFRMISLIASPVRVQEANSSAIF